MEARMKTRISVVVVALFGAACIPSEGPLMAPGQDCLGCHGGGGDAKTWTVAGTATGTMGGKGSRIAITDANGKSFTIRAAQNGNFYTAESVALPFTVSVDGKAMAYQTASRGPVGQVIPVSYGGCNGCHLADGSIVTFDEFMLPGSDCLSCHRAGGMAQNKPFSAAGTWFGSGHTVTVTGRSGAATMQTNRVGNFWTAAAITLPGTARVDGTTMEPALEYGGCGRCHG